MQIKSIHKAVGLGCIWATIMATPAMAFDTISIRQNGHDNEINAAQFDNHIVGDNRLSIEQNGGLSVATIVQSSSTDAMASITQWGSDNVNSIIQTGVTSSDAVIRQDGQHNMGSIVQFDGNRLSANINLLTDGGGGSYNTGEILQSGNEQTMSLVQGSTSGGLGSGGGVATGGSFNLAQSGQTGNYNTAIISQPGNDNIAILTQDGNGSSFADTNTTIQK